MLNAPISSVTPRLRAPFAIPHPEQIRHESPELAEFRAAVLEGLSGDPKRLPCRYFYDGEGSQLFDAICDQPEYYLTRTEDEILRSCGAELASRMPENVSLLELGSGTARKTRHVIAALVARQRTLKYYPADICGPMLELTAQDLCREFPRLEVMPVQGEYLAAIEKLRDVAPSPRLVLFLGSNLGNFAPAEAARFLSAVKTLLGEEDRFVLSVDAVKPVEVLEAAYNDDAGITARFNLNLLRRINTELGADFNLRAWEHQAFYDRPNGKIEMHLCSLVEQEVHLDGRTITFRPFETIHTEDSRKYTREQVEELAAAADLEVERVWTDPRDWFRVTLLRPTAPR